MEDRAIGYCPPVIYEFHGERQLIIWHPSAVSALNPETGSRLWSVPFRVQAGLTIGTPRRDENRLLVSAFYNGSRMLEIGTDGTPDILWQGDSDSGSRQTACTA